MVVLVAIFSRTPAWTIPPSCVAALRASFPDVEFRHVESLDALLDAAPTADIAFTSRLMPAAFEVATRLAWVHSPAAGVGAMLFPAMRDSAVLLTNSRGMNAAAVAEHAVGLLLALSRRLPVAFAGQREHAWRQDDLSALPSLEGRTVGIVGMGEIGRRIARVAAAFGMRVVATRINATAPRPPGVNRVLPPSGLSELLAEADVVVLAAPLTGDTVGLIGREQLARMKPSAWLINVARGKLLDEAALVDALAAGRLAGAGLDVFEHEPLAESSPLWGLPNVVLTPHVAGFRSDYWEAAVALFADNLRRYRSGQPLSNLVDKQAGY